jgi:predicted Rossmann-fold nucleotide-binding protein
MWNHLLIGAISPRPLVLVGPGWQETIEHFFRSFGGFVPERQRKLLIFARNVQEAARLVSQRVL